MKTLHKRIGALLLTFILFMTAFVTAGLLSAATWQTANADDETEIDYSDSLYYFSDSEPLITEDDIATLGNYKVYYDLHALSSKQEFLYLLYTGYFWRFVGFENVTVAFQLLSFDFDMQIWENLEKCLYEQKVVKILIIDTVELGFTDKTRVEFTSGRGDGFSEFLKAPFTKKINNKDEQEDDEEADVEIGCLSTIKDNTALLFDGSFIGLNSTVGDCNVVSLLHYTALHKLFNYFRFGDDEERIAQFEEQYYGMLWEFYRDNYLFDLFGDDVSFSEITDISNLFSHWKDGDKDQEKSNRKFWETHQEEYELFWDSTIIECYEDFAFVNEFYERNIHFFVNINKNIWRDFFDLDEAWNAQKYSFVRYDNLFDYLDPDITVFSNGEPIGPDDPIYPWEDATPLTVCAMMKWIMPLFTYNFLNNAQKAVEDKPSGFAWNIDELPVYLWEETPWFTSPNGLKIDSFEDTVLTEEELAKLLEILDYLLGVTG